MIKRIERADGPRYQVYAKRNGRKVYVGTYPSKRDAIAAEEDDRVTQRKIEAGDLPAELDLKRTLDQAAKEWLEALASAKSRSHRPYSEFMLYQVLPSLGSTPIAKLTKDSIRRWRDETTKRYAATSVNAALGCLSSACAWFVEKQWLAMNPCHGVDQAQVIDRAYNWIKTRGELERLLGVCPDELRDMIAVAVGTAIRIDEMLHLQWDDIDFAARLICVQRGRQGPPKNGRIRHVPILDAVLPVLQRRALKRGGNVLVFPGKRGAVRAQTPVTTAFKAAQRRAGMTPVRWHDLRHTMASWWVLAGGDIFRLSKLMGHRDVKITQRTYAHLAPEAWTQDYGRVSFRCPSEPAQVYEFQRDARGKMLGKRALGAGPVVLPARSDDRSSARA